MKFCPYCGASLADGAASFCAECGKALPSVTKQHKPHRKPLRHRSDAERKPRPKPNKHAQRQPYPVQKPERDSRDEGYDGYYNDVKPIDSGHVHNRRDSELTGRIIILSCGAFIAVVFSVILMYLL
jgi:hypothetical protein